MGNWFAYSTLAIWPMVTVWLFRTQPVTKAAFWTILGGHLLLPVKTAVDLPMIPPLGKATIPALTTYLACRFLAGRRIPIFGRQKIVRWLLLLFIAAPFITAELNGNVIHIGGGRILLGMTHYDALSAVINQFIVIIPFFIGRQFFRTYEAQLSIFRMLTLAGLFYSVPILLEVRLSPQLHTWIYGYFPHEQFNQQMRYGGFRPVVFVGHGLLVSFFITNTVLSASVMWKLKQKIRQFSAAGVTFYLTLVLALCKSAGSLLFGLLGIILTKLAGIKTQLRIATLLVSIALLYPSMSILNIFPHKAILGMTASVDADRSLSLAVRFDNEQRLLEHGREKFMFGWGTWGRNRIYDEETGRDMTITDGRWIITFSQFGWIGFIAEFGLMAIPIFTSITAVKKAGSNQEQIALAAHALLISMLVIDQIPNASLAPWLWLMTGALLGRNEEILSKPKIIPTRAKETSMSTL